LMTWTGLGSIMNVTFTTTPAAEIKCPDDFGKPLTELSDLLHLYLLERGFYIARRGFIAISLALSDGDLAKFIDAVRDFLEQYQTLDGLR
jgi:glutamate-1-semialdehyde 2,1-aminomutase